MKQKTLITDFTHGNIPAQLVNFAMPLFLSNLLQIAYNLSDMIIVERTMGGVGLAAVTVGGDVSSFLTFLVMGFSSAGQVIISRYIGAGEHNKLGKFISTMCTSLILAAFAMSAVCLIFRRQILILMNTPQEAFSEALSYSTVCIAGLVFIYGYNMISAVLRGLGDSKHPFIFISVAALLNVVLDLIFVPWLRLGAKGAALATVISQCVSFLSCTLFLYMRRDKLGFEIDATDFFHIDTHELGRLTKLGIPMAIKAGSIHFSMLFVKSYINSYGLAVTAFAGIAGKLSSISNLISNALNTAGSSMAGQNIAAKEYKRVLHIMLTVFAITFAISTIMSVCIILAPTGIFSLFSRDADVLRVGLEYIPIAVLMFYGSACRAPANAILNGSGNYKINFVTAILDGIVNRIGLSLLFGVALKMGYMGFWLGDALAGFTPMIIGIFFYISGNWKK